jgi:hypothetical protein
MTAGDERSGSWFRDTSNGSAPGFCVGDVWPAASGSPITRPFAVPHKRYVRPPVREKGREYLGTDTSYRKVVHHEGMPILYDDREANRIPAGKDRVPGLAASTVWRWLSWLGNLENVLREASQLIRRKAPSSALHRETWPLHARKYRSDARRQTLQRAVRCLVTESLFRELFDQEMFPHFATAHGWN